MIRFILVTFILIVSLQAKASSDEQALRQTIKKFETAIINKDKNEFLSLFIKGTVSWVGVFSQSDFDKELAWAKSKEGQALKKQIGDKFREPAKYRQSTPLIFIESIIDNTKQPKEDISNIAITSDGEVATIQFDYVFYDSGKKINSGKENWQLINTGTQWKINSVNFSISRG